MLIQGYIEGNKTTFEKHCLRFHVIEVYGVNLTRESPFNKLHRFGLLVDIEVPDPLKRGDYLIDLWDEMDTFFKQKINLFTPVSIRNSVLKEMIEPNKINLYARDAS